MPGSQILQHELRRARTAASHRVDGYEDQYNCYENYADYMDYGYDDYGDYEDSIDYDDG